MNWKNLPRKEHESQEHEAVGEAAAPQSPGEVAEAPNGMFGSGGLGERVQAVAHGVVGSLPRALRPHAAAQYDAGNLSRLTEAMTAWTRGCHFSVEEFSARFFGQAAGDLLLEKLHSAALDVVLAISHEELREAAEKVAAVMQAIGLDRWPRVLADAHQRAHDPETIAAIERPRAPPEPQSARPNATPAEAERAHAQTTPAEPDTAHAKTTLAEPDAERSETQPAESQTQPAQPVYRLQALLGIAAADLKGGAIRRTDGASARQVWPQRATSPASGRGRVAPVNTIPLPTGKPVGTVIAGVIPEVRIVRPAELQTIHGRMLQGAMPLDKPGYPGRWYRRADGSLFGVRRSAGANPTIDIDDPALPHGLKVHAA